MKAHPQQINLQEREEIAEAETFVRFRSLTHSGQSGRRENPVLHPVRGFLVRVPIGRHLSLHRLRGDRRPVVRRLLHLNEASSMFTFEKAVAKLPQVIVPK